MTGKIVCFGELLLRLGAPAGELLLQTPRLEVQVGGAEANVAVALACLGHRVRMVSRVPAGALGATAAGELRRHGVDTSEVRTGDGRMGLYFLCPGALHRPSEVIYDRQHSAFALADENAVDWHSCLEGATRLHLSGVTPALGPGAAAAAIRAARAATAAGVKVSFDGNFRGKLWQLWAGDAPALLRQIISEADVVFADHRDVSVLLGLEFGQADPCERFGAAARAAFDAFPRLQYFAATRRHQHSVGHHTLGASMATRDGTLLQTQTRELLPIVDRIGTGDAFAAGLLHGLHSGASAGQSLQYGFAAACLKHSVNGDFAPFQLADLDAFVDEVGLDVKR